MAFDVDDGDFIFGSGKNRFDSEGHMMYHTGGNWAIDMETGEMHYVNGWEDDDEDDD